MSKDATPHILSTSAEQVVKSISVSACNYEAEGSATSPGGLQGSEKAGQLACMTRPQFLTLMCYVGADFSVRDLQELQHFIMTEVIMKQAWYQQGSYYGCHRTKQRLDGLTMGAIGFQLTPNKQNRLTKEEVARGMGITTSSFNELNKHGDSWALRFQQINRHLQGWLEVAAQVVHNNGRNI